MVSNGTDSSTKKPEDAIDHIERSSLPEYTLRPIDSWKHQNQTNSNMAYNSLDYPKVTNSTLVNDCEKKRTTPLKWNFSLL